ncbi:MAG TPA: SIS domain-containing protein, partial [Actinomycetota bacterium]|nr:SIS domain-containing protein [Actinomycetota bacterium]
AAHHSYGVPAWCGRETHVVVSSYSGSTAETLSALRAAVESGASGCAVASGGPLLEEAEGAGWATLRVPGGAMPRYAIGHLTVGALLPLGAGPHHFVDRLDVGASVGSLRERVTEWGPDVPGAENLAKDIARRLQGALPVVWGGPGVTGVAAARWRSDLNENAKVLAHSAVLPELDHNEIVGLGPDGSAGRPDVPIVLVCLRDVDEDPRVSERFAATLEEVRAGVSDVVEVRPRGAGPLERFFDLAMLSGYVSVYLALARGVDPTTISSIDRLKQSLSGS